MSMMSFVRNLFVQQHENNYTPRSLRGAAVFGMVVLILLTFVTANIHSLILRFSDSFIATVLPSVITTETNRERALRDAPPLAHSTTLDQAATLKAQHMSENEYFAHFSPDGVSPWHWFDEVSYSYRHAGENLALFFTDSRAVVNGWMDSPLHRENILNPVFSEIGVGVATGTHDGHDTVYVVQLFGTPHSGVSVTEPEESVAGGLATTASDSERSVVAGVATDTSAVTEPVAFSSLTTSTSPTGAVGATHAQSTPWWYTLATSPSTWMQVVYIFVGGFVLVALILSILIDIRRQHPRQIAYGVGLLCLMLLLFHMHVAVTNGVPIA